MPREWSQSWHRKPVSSQNLWILNIYRISSDLLSVDIDAGASVTVRDRDDAIWLITLEEVFSRPSSHTQSHNPPWGLRAALPGLGRIMLSWAGRRKIRILLKQNKSQLACCAPVMSQSIRFSQMIFVLLAFVSRNGDNNLPQLRIVFTGALVVCPQFSALLVTLHSRRRRGRQIFLTENVIIIYRSQPRSERGWKLISNFTDRGDNLRKYLIQTDKNI